MLHDSTDECVVLQRDSFETNCNSQNNPSPQPEYNYLHFAPIRDLQTLFFLPGFKFQTFILGQYCECTLICGDGHSSEWSENNTFLPFPHQKESKSKIYFLCSFCQVREHVFKKVQRLTFKFACCHFVISVCFEVLGWFPLSVVAHAPLLCQRGNTQL